MVKHAAGFVRTLSTFHTSLNAAIKIEIRAYLSTIQTRKKGLKFLQCVVVLSKRRCRSVGALRVRGCGCDARRQRPAGFYPTGAARRTEPCSHWRGRRRGRGGRGCGLIGKKRCTHTYTRTHTHKRKTEPGCDGITPAERLYGNTCQRGDLFPFTSIQHRLNEPLWWLICSNPSQFLHNKEGKKHNLIEKHRKNETGGS